jgi:hypothetical protein
MSGRGLGWKTAGAATTLRIMGGAAGVIAFLGVAGGAVATVFLLDTIPFKDAADWAHQGWILNRCLAGDTLCRDFAFKPYPVANSTATVLFAVAHALAEPLRAAQAVVAGTLILWAFAAWRLAAGAEAGARGPWALLLFGLFGLSTPFWLGYLNFQIGSALLALAIGRVHAGRAGRIEIAIWATALFFTHALPFAAFLVAAGWLALTRAGRRGDLLALAPAIALGAWYATARALLDADLAPATPPPVFEGWEYWWRYLRWKLVHPFAQGPGRLLIAGETPLLPMDEAARFALDAASACVSGVLLAAIFRGARASWADGERLGFAPGAVFLIAFLAAPPVNFLGLVNPGERFLLLGLLLLVPLAQLPRRAAHAIAALALILHGVNAAQLARFDAAVAAGRHLAPFRTEDYSPYAVPLAARQFLMEALARGEAPAVEPGYATGIFRARR